MPTINPRLLALGTDSGNNRDSYQQCETPRRHRHIDLPGTQSNNTKQRITREARLKNHHASEARYNSSQRVFEGRTPGTAHGNANIRDDTPLMVRLEVTLDGFACIVVDKSRYSAWQRTRHHRSFATSVMGVRGLRRGQMHRPGIMQKETEQAGGQ